MLVFETRQLGVHTDEYAWWGGNDEAFSSDAGSDDDCYRSDEVVYDWPDRGLTAKCSCAIIPVAHHSRLPFVNTVTDDETFARASTKPCS